MGEETIMKWFGTSYTLHVVSEKIYEIKARTPDGDYVKLELWPGESLLAYAMHRPGDDALCLVKVLEDGELDRYLVPISRARLYLMHCEKTLFVDTRIDENEEARLMILDNLEQATLFNAMFETMQICSTDERRVM